jgi:Domain of unknown function (DUF4249)
MRYAPPLAWLLGSTLLLGDCAEEIVIQLPDEPPKLVAVGHFMPDRPFLIDISTTQFIHDNSKPVRNTDDIDVLISSDGRIIERLQPDPRTWFWRSRTNAQADKTYQLTVRRPGFESIEAVSRTPVHIVPNCAMHAPVVEKHTDGSADLRIPLDIRISKLPPTGHFFAFSLQDEVEVKKIIDGRVVGIEIRQNPRTFFVADGRTSALLYDIAEPVVMIHENYWNDDRTTLSLRAIIPFDPATERPRRLFLEWRTLSEEFYKYHLTLTRQSASLPFSDPDAVYNNIKGGFGNFSGYTASYDTLMVRF